MFIFILPFVVCDRGGRQTATYGCLWSSSGDDYMYLSEG